MYVGVSYMQYGIVYMCILYIIIYIIIYNVTVILIYVPRKIQRSIFITDHL